MIPCVFNNLLHRYTFYCLSEQCRSRSSGTLMPSDQNWHCLLFDSLGYYWTRCNHASSEDPHQTAWMYWLIWIYTGHTCVKLCIIWSKQLIRIDLMENPFIVYSGVIQQIINWSYQPNRESIGPYEIVQRCRLIWVYTGSKHDKCLLRVNPLLNIYMFYCMCKQPGHPCHLIRIWTGRILVRNNLMNSLLSTHG
jgi:hypothetical protein